MIKIKFPDLGLTIPVVMQSRKDLKVQNSAKVYVSRQLKLKQILLRVTMNQEFLFSKLQNFHLLARKDLKRMNLNVQGQVRTIYRDKQQ